MVINQRKFTRAWTIQGYPLIFVETVFVGDTVIRKKLLGHSYGGHILVSRQGAVTFYQNRNTIRQVQRIAERTYQNIRFLKRFFTLVAKTEKDVKKTLRVLEKTDTTQSTTALYESFSLFTQAYAQLMALYRFTRPDVYGALLDKIRGQLPPPQDHHLNLLLDNSFSRLPFRITKRRKKLFREWKKIAEVRWEMHKLYVGSYEKAVHKFFRVIALKMRYPLKYILNCTHSEIRDFLLKNIKPERNVLRKRLRAYTFIYHGNTYRLLLGHTQGSAKRKIGGNNNIFQGTPSFPGKYSGKARLITHHFGRSMVKEMKAMKQGEVLVTVSTSPDMLPAIRKAGAIIVDEGGLLSHAAIVSREYKIPCLVGTHLASHVLHSGDRVEVDANKGIVRKL